MNATLGKFGIVALVALYLIVFGFVSGMLVERMRFDWTRSIVLIRLDATEQRLRARLMEIERVAESPRSAQLDERAMSARTGP
jgi:hypothetical protein